MFKNINVRIKLFSAIMATAIVFNFAPVRALSGDGTNFAYCTGRYTIAVKTWGVAKMTIFGCSNGYVFTNVTSSTTYAKGARITRDTPSATRWSDTTGYSRYGTQTNMLRYVNGSCYSGQGWSMDSLSGRRISYVWCI